MANRDLVLLSTFVNALILGFLLVVSKGEEETPTLPPQKIEKVTSALSPEVAKVPSPQVMAQVVEETQVPPLILPIEPPPLEEWYVMKSGDNPWKVAKTQKIKFDDLLRLNGLNEERARNLKPGDRIKIR